MYPLAQFANTTSVQLRRLTKTGPDDYGNDIFVPAEITLDGCVVYPRGSTEDSTDGGSQVFVGLTMFAPTTEKIRPTDEVDVDGVTYRVEGEPGLWRDWTDIEFQQVALERVSG